MKSINYRFWIVEVLKAINNCLITVLNRMDQLQHWIKNFFGRSTKKFPQYVCYRKYIIVIGSEGQIDALPWIAEGYGDQTKAC